MMHWMQNVRGAIGDQLDNLAEAVRRSEGSQFSRDPQRIQKTRITSPEDDVKKLITSANSLDDVWQFITKRLRSGSAPSFMLFSVVDEVTELLRLRYLHPHRSDNPFQGEFIPLCDKENHLVKTALRADTTFTNRFSDLGRELYPYLIDQDIDKQNVFSIPLVAGNRTVAMVTLGFDVLDSFSQAKLSYVYLLRDQLAQLVWNLILQERVQNQPQLDNLTGLMTLSSFHQVLTREVKRARSEDFPLSLMLVDINDLKRYNEQYSHQMGDGAVAWLASVIKHEVRGIDTISRYGPDEIGIILPESDLHDAQVVAQRIIHRIEKPHNSIKPFSLSIGLATCPQDSASVDGLTRLVENAVQLGKHHASGSHKSQITLPQALRETPNETRLELFAAQIAKAYGEPGSDLFESLMRRIRLEGRLDSDPMMLETVASLAGAMDAKDHYTQGHSQAVANFAVALAHGSGLPAGEVEKIRLAGFFHDIGKIGIPEAILNKTGPLTVDEMTMMRQHPVIGARQILQPVSALKDIVPMVEYHHERWDGTGYPAGLKGENIPVGARIIAIVDAFHAMTSNKPYQEAMSLDEARRTLGQGAGSQWDPQLISTFLKILEKASLPDPPALHGAFDSSAPAPLQ